MTWEAGTVAANKVKVEVAAWIVAAFAGSYASRLSGVKYNTRIDDTALKLPGVTIEILTGGDTEAPWRFAAETGDAIEDHHRLVLNAQSDEVGGDKRKAGYVPADEKVFEVLKLMLSNPTDKTALAARGVYNVRISPEAQSIEGVEFKRPLEITCTTDTYIE